MPQERDATRDPDRLAEIQTVAREAATAFARRCGIPGCEDDLAQEGLLGFLEDGGSADVRAHVRRAARREQSRRRRHATSLDGRALGTGGVLRHAGVAWDPVLAPARGVPRLCPDLAFFGRGTRRERRLARAIRNAAYVAARQPKVLARGQFRVFVFAYVEGLEAGEIAALLGTTSGAATKRVGRVAERIEKRLAAAVAAAIDVEPGDRNAKGVVSPSPSAATACAHLLRALERVIHRNPGIPRPMGQERSS